MPTTAAVTAYQQGEAYERLFQDISLSPGTCAIALERAQCVSDLELVSSMRGQDPTDAQARKWFASGDISLRVENWNGIYVPDKAWSDDPVFAWWYTAGVVSIAASLPHGGPLDDIPRALRRRACKTCLRSTGQLFEVGTHRQYPRRSSRIGAEQPPHGFSRRAISGPFVCRRPVAYAQLGVYVDTLQQLVDNPAALSRPASRAFGRCSRD